MKIARAWAGVSPCRFVAVWVCRVIAAAVVAECILNLTVTRAVADPGPVVQQYTCQLPIVGAQPLTASIAWPSGLNTATVGSPTPRLPVAMTGTMGPIVGTAASVAGAEWVEGTSDVTAEVVAPQGGISRKVALAVPRTNVSDGSGTLTVSATGPLPSLDFSQPGSGEVIVRGMVVHLATLTSSGGPTWLGEVSITCTLNSGQNDVVASFRILPAVTSSSPSSSSPVMAKSPANVPSKHVGARPASAPSSTRPSPPSRPWGRIEPLAHSVPGFVTLIVSALLALCAAVVSILKAVGNILGNDIAAAIARFIEKLKPWPPRPSSGTSSDPGRSPDEAGLTEAARCLAKIVQERIQGEHEQLRLAEPGLLPVRWQKVNPHSGHKLRFKNAPGDISATYNSISTGRLVVLGRAGSGKSVLVQCLALELLGDPERKEYSSPEEPVPVIVDVSSWDPGVTLDDWLVGQIASLRDDSAPPAEMVKELVKKRLILAIFDGFDEISDPRLRAKFLEDLSAVPGRRTVLTSRPEEYLETVNGGRENGIALSKSAIIELTDLSVRDSLSYLLQLSYRRSGRSAWQPVADELGKRRLTPLAASLVKVLRTPRMVALARDSYRSRDPAELLTIHPGSPEAIEDHLRKLLIP
jgi:NACHT domain